MMKEVLTIPGPECDHEPEPGEEECAAIACRNGVEEGDRASLLIDRVYLWRAPEEGEGIHVGGRESK